MSDELENVEYEDDEGTATPVEILPPVVQKRRRDWKDFVLWGLAAVIAWHVIDRLADRMNPAPAQASMVSMPRSSTIASSEPERKPPPDPPVPQERPKFNMDRAVGETERAPSNSESWRPGLRLAHPLAPQRSPELERADRRLMDTADAPNDLEEAMRQRQVLRDWGPPPCPPRYHHERGDPTWSCWPN